MSAGSGRSGQVGTWRALCWCRGPKVQIKHLRCYMTRHCCHLVFKESGWCAFLCVSSIHQVEKKKSRSCPRFAENKYNSSGKKVCGYLIVLKIYICLFLKDIFYQRFFLFKRFFLHDIGQVLTPLSLNLIVCKTGITITQINSQYVFLFINTIIVIISIIPFSKGMIYSGNLYCSSIIFYRSILIRVWFLV